MQLLDAFFVLVLTFFLATLCGFFNALMMKKNGFSPSFAEGQIFGPLIPVRGRRKNRHGKIF